MPTVCLYVVSKMDIKETFKLLQESDEFKQFSENEEGFVLAHAYYEKEHDKEKPWEIGFYNKKRDRMVVFETNPIKRLPEQEIFKKGKLVKTLNLDLVDVSFEEAMMMTENIRREKYSSSNISKYLVILQNLDKQVWNITLISTSFDLINIRIDAVNGDIIGESKSSILDLGIRSL